MENDSIRSTGTNTLVDIWIDGKMRAISVSHDAIGAFLGFDRATGMAERDRSEFVRAHLPLLVTAARARLRDTNPDPDEVVIDLGDLPRSDGQSGDRRKAKRRTDERRKVGSPVKPQMERRRRERRQTERRTTPSRPE